MTKTYDGLLNPEGVNRPTGLREHHLLFLDDLRASGITNMYGAVPYLKEAYRALDQRQASAVLSYWMQTFTTRHPQPQGKP